MEIIGCTFKFNSKHKLHSDGYMKNFNYNPLATKHNGIEIPFLDLNNDGKVNEDEVNIILEDLVSDKKILTPEDVKRIREETFVIEGTNNVVGLMDLAFLLTVIRINKQ